MKVVIAFLALIGLSVAYEYQGNYKVADKAFLRKQHDVWQLFKYINNPAFYNKEYSQIVNSYSIQEHSHKYTPEVIQQFNYFFKKGFLPKEEVFSIFNDVHVEQVQALFKLFYYAQDYETFYKTAVWARFHFNEAMFLYTFSVAVVHRPDTYGLVLPPIYEIYPHYFFNSEVIHKAYKYKMMHYGEQHHQDSEYKDYVIYANYSGDYLNLHPEQSLSYYTEDIGMNAFYYYYNLYYPYWMDGTEFHIKNDLRGEHFYYIHQQILARYYLERLSHGVGGFEFFNWELPFETGYYPSLIYPNGLAFPERPHFANLQEYFYNYGQNWCFKSKYGYSFTYVNTAERRIRDAFDLGFVYDFEGKKIDLNTHEGFNVLGNIIEGNADSPNYKFYGEYIKFARHLLGYAKQPLDDYKLLPSALEHFETSLRDPAFYVLFKKVILLFQKYKWNQPAYVAKDLVYRGVEVDKIEVDPLVTFYDDFYTDITNGLFVTPEEYEQYKPIVRVHQYRLNHKRFNYKVFVTSDKTAKVAVKIFLGPKYDEHGRHIDISENRINFVELDHFVYDLKSGQNVMQRSSMDSPYFVKDRTSYYDMYKKILGAYTGNEQFHLNGQESYYGFPHRFMLPRGSEAGIPFYFYAIVYPYVPYQHKEQIKSHGHYYYPKVATGMSKFDNFPMGYPFDRHIEYYKFEHLPNAKFYEVKVFHQVFNKTDSVEHTENVLPHFEHDLKEDVYEQPGSYEESHQHDNIEHDSSKVSENVLPHKEKSFLDRIYDFPKNIFHRHRRYNYENGLNDYYY